MPRRSAARRDAEPAARAPLTRQRVLEAAVGLVDEHGLGDLSMRKLGTKLGVEAMSLYNHVDGKDDLHDGIVEVLWSEAETAAKPAEGWQEAVRALAYAVRGVVHRHPGAAPLLTSRWAMPAPSLRLFGRCLRVLTEAGFRDDRAAEVVRSILAYAFGYAFTEISALAPEVCATAQEPEIQRLRRISQALPRDLPHELFQVALAVCSCDIEQQFEVGLDLMLSGLEARPERHGPVTGA